MEQLGEADELNSATELCCSTLPSSGAGFEWDQLHFHEPSESPGEIRRSDLADRIGAGAKAPGSFEVLSKERENQAARTNQPWASLIFLRILIHTICRLRTGTGSP
jgi:hypothetical protein